MQPIDASSPICTPPHPNAPFTLSLTLREIQRMCTRRLSPFLANALRTHERTDGQTDTLIEINKPHLKNFSALSVALLSLLIRGHTISPNFANSLRIHMVFLNTYFDLEVGAESPHELTKSLRIWFS